MPADIDIKKKFRFGQAAMVTIYVLACLILLTLIFLIIKDSGAPDSLVLETIGIIILQWIIHEWGHLIGGWITGYRFLLYRIGPFALARIDHKIRFIRIRVPEISSRTLMSPPKQKADGRISVGPFISGGIWGNVLMTAISAILIQSTSDSSLRSFYYLMACIGALFVVINALPFHMESFDKLYNDGYTLIRLHRNKELNYGLWLRLKVTQEITEGKRLAEMPESWFTKIDTKDTKIWRVKWYLDRHEFARTEAAAKELLDNELLTESERSLLKLILIYCQAIQGEKVRWKYLGKASVQRFMFQNQTHNIVLLTYYIQALFYDHNLATAHLFQEKFAHLSAHNPYLGNVKSTQELFHLAEDKYERELAKENDVSADYTAQLSEK